MPETGFLEIQACVNTPALLYLRNGLLVAAFLLVEPFFPLIRDSEGQGIVEFLTTPHEHSLHCQPLKKLELFSSSGLQLLSTWW